LSIDSDEKTLDVLKMAFEMAFSIPGEVFAKVYKAEITGNTVINKLLEYLDDYYYYVKRDFIVPPKRQNSICYYRSKQENN
jgi:hypothetical protein